MNNIVNALCHSDPKIGKRWMYVSNDRTSVHFMVQERGRMVTVTLRDTLSLSLSFNEKESDILYLILTFRNTERHRDRQGASFTFQTLPRTAWSWDPGNRLVLYVGQKTKEDLGSRFDSNLLSQATWQDTEPQSPVSTGLRGLVRQVDKSEMKC